VGLIDDIKRDLSGDSDSDQFMDEETREPRRGQPGEASEFDLKQNLVFGGQTTERPKPDLDAISAGAAEAAGELIQEMTPDEADFQRFDTGQEHSNNSQAVGEAVDAARDMLTPRSVRDWRTKIQVEEAIRAQARADVAPKQDYAEWTETAQDDDEYEPVAAEAEFTGTEPVEVAETEEVTPFDDWGLPPQGQPTAATVQERLDALEDDDSDESI
jgi:hypothetical protein